MKRFWITFMRTVPLKPHKEEEINRMQKLDSGKRHSIVCAVFDIGNVSLFSADRLA